MRVLIGVDVGTSATKAVALDGDGTVRNVASVGYRLRVPGPGRAELDATELRAAVVEATISAASEAARRGDEVSGICVSAAMHGLVALDADGRPEGPLLTWADSRSGAQARALRFDPVGAGLHERSGAPVHPMSPLVKLLWLREHDPHRLASVPWWGGVKELALSALAGARATDLSSAGATGMVDARAGSWDAEALRLTGVREEQLATVVDTTDVVGQLRAELAARAGLPGPVPVVAGATDGVLGNLGTGAITPAVGAVSLGTSGALRTVRPDFGIDSDHRLFCYALLPGRWVAGGAVNNAGSVVRWASRALGALPDPARGSPDEADVEAADARMVAEAAAVPPGAEGLLALPYLLGERAPWWNPDLSGAWLGLRRHHSRGHLVRAGMEGVCLQLALVLEALSAVGARPDRIRATGGALRAPLWAQLLAAALELPVDIGADTEGSAAGAALLGHHALGDLPDLDAVVDRIRVVSTVEPDPALVAVARRRLPLVSEAVSSVADVLHTLSDESAAVSTEEEGP